MNKRQKEVIQHQLTMEKAVLDALEKEYEAALKDIKMKIQMLQADPLTQSRIYHIQYQNTLKKQVEAALEKLHSDEYSTIQQYLSESYTDAFVGAMYDVHGQGVPVIAPIDQNAAIKAVMTDSKLSEPLYDALGVDVKKLKKTISAEISRGIASGLFYDEIARNIQFFSNAPISRAKTIVRTEGHRIQEASAEDARQQAKAKGADVVKQWDATLDGDTRPTHRELDGQIRETDEPFEANGKKAMYPGDFGDPAEDCNCRCVALTRAKWALDEDELKILRQRAVRHSLYMDDPKTYRAEKLPTLKNYAEFKKSYLKAAQTIENTGKSGIMKLGKFNTTDDPMREVTGAGIESNPEEINEILNELKAAGVEVVHRQEGMAYIPGIMPGQAGQFIITPDASYSAWLHERQHFLDDKADGFPGMRIFEDIERCKQREISAYNVEIELAKKLGRKDIVERLEALKVKEVSKYDEGTDED